MPAGGFGFIILDKQALCESLWAQSAPPMFEIKACTKLACKSLPRRSPSLARTADDGGEKFKGFSGNK
jgi:hypothetical protein